jgi:hypothetical protein
VYLCAACSTSKTNPQGDGAAFEEDAVAVVTIELGAVVGGEERHAHGQGCLAGGEGTASGAGLDEDHGTRQGTSSQPQTIAMRAIVTTAENGYRMPCRRRGSGSFDQISAARCEHDERRTGGRGRALGGKTDRGHPHGSRRWRHESARDGREGEVTSGRSHPARNIGGHVRGRLILGTAVPEVWRTDYGADARVWATG